MYIVFSNYTTRPNIVAWDYDDNWDLSTQTVMEIDEVANASVTVDVPDGQMPLVDALWQRPGAFLLVGGVLRHDETYRVEDM